MRRAKLKSFYTSKNLVELFGEVKNQQKYAAIRRTGLVTLDASLIRVFEEKTKDDILSVLVSVPIEDLRKISNESEFKTFYKQQLDRIENAVLRKNARNEKLGKGLKWGHCTKILSIFVREIVLRSRICSNKEVKRLVPLLYVPLDSKVLGKLRGCGLSEVPNRIKDLSTAKQFWNLQELVRKAAKQAGTSAIYLDDVWVEG
ncbi:MAG: hypothetical protein ABSG44_09825 [Thermodesulfobacteriota bacterium]|jgi:hypothetical protein